MLYKRVKCKAPLDTHYPFSIYRLVNQSILTVSSALLINAAAPQALTGIQHTKLMNWFSNQGLFTQPIGLLEAIEKPNRKMAGFLG